MGKSKTDRPGLGASARKVWLAGLGALAEAEDKGDKFFKALVKKGKSVEPAFQAPFDSASDAVRDSVTAARDSATKGIRELESAIDRAVQSALKRAGLASSKDVEALRKEIAKLKRKTKGDATAKKKAPRKRSSGSTRKKKTAPSTPDSVPSSP